MGPWMAAKAVRHDSAGAGPSQWSLGQKWRQLSALDKAEYLALHTGLAVAAAPLVAITLASLPISLPALWLSKRAAQSPGGVAPGFLMLPSLLALAPGLMSGPYRALDEWMRDRAGAPGGAHKPGEPENPIANRALEEALWRKKPRDIQRALKAGANPNAATSVGDTPLIVACIIDDHACVQILLSAGADPNAVGRHGARALGYSAINGSVAIGRQLIEAGAALDDPQAEDASGRDIENYARQGPAPELWLNAMMEAQERRNTLAASAPAPDTLKNLAQRRKSAQEEALLRKQQGPAQ